MYYLWSTTISIVFFAKNAFAGLITRKLKPGLPNILKWKSIKKVRSVKTQTVFTNLLTVLNKFKTYLVDNCYITKSWLSNSTTSLKSSLKRIFGDAVLYLKGLFIIFFTDALIIDDEPLWEPIEWSMVQSWILFIFLFGWIAENLIVSRYGSYTGRDKRVWFSWYKTFWFIDLIYLLSLAFATLFVMTPFYYEINYIMSFTTSWWHWYTRVFFLKFISLNLIVILITQILQINIRRFNWKKLFFLVLVINMFFSYILYTHFFLTFFSYFTQVNWYNTTRLVDYVQLSHEPAKWSWGNKKRDHFSYHKTSTIFWFKNDGPMAAAFLCSHVLFFITTFLTYSYWLILLRRIYVTQEISYTYTLYAISSLKQLFYFFLLTHLFTILSYLICYWRFPFEFSYTVSTDSWFINFLQIINDYPSLLISLINF